MGTEALLPTRLEEGMGGTTVWVLMSEESI